MTKYKLVIVSSKCETISEKLKSKLLLYPCVDLEFSTRSRKKAEHKNKFSSNLQK